MPVNTNKPAEFLLFDFLAEQIALAVNPDTEALYEMELHDTIFQQINTSKGLRISDAIGEMAPDTGGAVREFNVALQIVCYSKVEGVDNTERQAAMTAVWNMQKAVYFALVTSNSLGGRVCDVLVEPGARSYEVFDGDPYAIAVIPITINPGSGS